MESKKINQLATELAPDLSDLTIIGDPTTGISKKITLSQMASLFTGTVEEYPNLASFPLVGTADTIYIALDTNIIYRWNTSTNAYVELSPNIVTSLVFNDANGFDGTISLVGSTATLTITTALTQGSVPFIGTSGALTQDNANLFFDDTNNRLGINTSSPTTVLDVFGSGIIGRVNGTSTNNAFLGFANAGTNRWSIGNVQSDHRFRIFSETNTSELVTVLQTGEFGIGIANPTTKVHIDGGATALIANLDANVSVAKSLSFRSDNSNRINLEVSGTESGSNAGANFFIRRYSDAGALIDTPLTITRSTGAISLATTLNLTEIQASTSAGITLKSNGGTSVALFGAGGGAGTTLYGGLSATTATFTGDVELNGASGTRTLTIQNNTSGNAVLSLVAAGSNSGSITYNRSTSELIFGNSGATSALKIAANGMSIFGNSVGLGITPSTSTDPAFQSRYGIFIGNDESNIINNGYFNSGFKYVQSSFFANRYYQDGYNGGHIWYTAPSGTANSTLTWNERMRISAIGNLEVRNDNSNSYIYLTNTLNTSTTNKNTILQFRGTDTGNSIKDAGAIQVVPTGVNYIDTNMIFYVRGSDSQTEKIRITSGGYLKVSNNSTYTNVNATTHEFNNNVANWVLVNRNSNANPNGILIDYTTQPINSGNEYLYCTDNSISTLRASIRSNGGIANFQANNVNLSDERTKKDIIPLESYWNKFKAIQIVKFKYKDQTHDDFNIGVIAQQVEKVAPEFIDIDGWGKPKLDEEGNEIISEEEPLKSVYTADLHHATIKVLQEAMAKIEILEEEVKLLKAK